MTAPMRPGPDVTPAPAGGKVRLTPVRPAEAGLLLGLVGDDQLGGGGAVWGSIERPRRKTAVEWTGVSALTYVLPLLLDGMEASTGRDASVEGECRTLLRWWSQPTKATGQPVVLTAVGPLQTPAATLWVITDMEWGAKVRNGVGRRVQQYVTVTLGEYVEATVRRSPARASRNRKGKD